MSKTVWHKGPPPSVGWWPASVCEDSTCIRWWNGKWWSTPCYKNTLLVNVAVKAKMKSVQGPFIYWAKRPANWPARSRT